MVGGFCGDPILEMPNYMKQRQVGEEKDSAEPISIPCFRFAISVNVSRPVRNCDDEPGKGGPQQPPIMTATQRKCSSGESQNQEERRIPEVAFQFPKSSGELRRIMCFS